MKWIIPVLIVLIISNIVLAEKLKIDQNIEVSNKNVTLLGVGPESIKISVNEQGAILKLNEVKVINGLKIQVFEIFYAGDEEINYADITASPTFSCGDKKCDEEEKDSCCSDCGCSKGYECDNNRCELIPECKEDIDCEDNNANTEDKCKQGKCFNTFVCTLNSQCEDNDECTKDYCEDGTCFNEDLPECQKKEETKTEEKVEEKQKTLEDTKEEQVNNIKEEIKEEKKGFFSSFIGFFKRLFTGELFKY